MSYASLDDNLKPWMTSKFMVSLILAPLLMRYLDGYVMNMYIYMNALQLLMLSTVGDLIYSVCVVITDIFKGNLGG